VIVAHHHKTPTPGARQAPGQAGQNIKKAAVDEENSGQKTVKSRKERQQK